MPIMTPIQVVREEIKKAREDDLTISTAIVMKRNDVKGVIDVQLRGSPSWVTGVRVVEQVHMEDLSLGESCLVIKVATQWFCIASFSVKAKQRESLSHDITLADALAQSIGSLSHKLKNIFTERVTFGDGDYISYDSVTGSLSTTLSSVPVMIVKPSSIVFQPTTSDSHQSNICVTSTSIQFRDGDTVMTDISSDSITVGEVGAGLSNVYITAGEIQLRSNVTSKLSMDVSGNLWASSKITAGTGNNIGVLDGADATYRIYAGHAAPASAPFSVTEAGALKATSGNVGSWELSTLSLGGMDPRATALEIVSAAFRWVSWAQFAMYDNFNDALYRASPDPSTYDASIDGGVLSNGGDTTADRAFGWYSKIYTNITTVATGTSTGVGSGYLEDSAASWFTDQYKSYILVDSATTVFTISGCTESPRRLTVTGTPAAGAYSIRADDPFYCAGFVSYTDSTGDGSGFTKLEVSFDNGANWQLLLDTSVPTNNLGGAVEITNSGHDHQFRVTITNDGAGDGAVVHNVIACTDPSLWG